MSLSNGFRRIADLLDEIEADDIEVRDAAMPATERSVRDGTVEVTLDLVVTVGDESTSEESSSAPVNSTANSPEADRDQQSAETSGTAETDQIEAETDESDDVAGDGTATESAGGVVCPEPGCDESFESEPGMKIHRTKVHRSTEAATTGDEPAYRDPEALRDAYEAHDSFPAMREALGVDVSAQTVRRHMIQHGIHDPEADSAGTDATGDTDPEADVDTDTGNSDPATADDTPAASDGRTADERPADVESLIPEATPLTETLPSAVTAPEGVTFAELRVAVRTANTLYDIQQQFGLDRDEARDLLDHLDLLELVHGRVATKHEREELKAEIDSRIRHSIESSGTSA